MRPPLALFAPLLLGFAATVPVPATAQPPAPAKAGPLATVPTDAFAFLTVNVGKLHDAPGFKPLRDWFAPQKIGPTDDLLGLRAAEIDRVTVFMPAATMKAPPVMLVTTRGPYNEARVLKALRADRADERRRPRIGNAIETDNDRYPVVVLVDDRTLVFLPDARDNGLPLAGLVGQLIAKKPDGPLATALADAEKHDLAFALDVRPVAALFDLNRDRDAAPYLALWKARTLTFAADFDKTARGSLKLAFADAADAKRAAPVLKEAIAEAAAALEKEAARDKGRADTTERLFFESAAAVLRAAKVEAEGANVFATGDVPYQDAVAKFAAVLPKEYTAAVGTAKALNNLKELALAMHGFHDANSVFPGDVLTGGPNRPAWSWRVQILPYIEQANLYQQLDFTKSWDDPANLKKLEAMEMPRQFEVPGRPAPKGHTYFRVFTKPKNAKGTERPWLVEGEPGPKITTITDGTSNTLMIVEAGEAVPWYKPDVLAYDGVLPLPPLGDKRADRFLAALGDGSVRAFRPSKLGEKTIRALITPQGGEVITLP
ncbi:MAG: DUF1559 domain-containing protein [Planctomycetes bacterium]|nr:DUF1559 domain-containing protein [Planctomycetota bacterium]